MRLWVGNGNAGSQVDVLRVTLSNCQRLSGAAIDHAERLTASCAGQHVVPFLGALTIQ